MARSQFPLAQKPGSVQHETWATALEFVFIASVMFFITIGTLHMIGINPFE